MTKSTKSQGNPKETVSTKRKLQESKRKLQEIPMGKNTEKTKKDTPENIYDHLDHVSPSEFTFLMSENDLKMKNLMFILNKNGIQSGWDLMKSIRNRKQKYLSFGEMQNFIVYLHKRYEGGMTHEEVNGAFLLLRKQWADSHKSNAKLKIKSVEQTPLSVTKVGGK